MFGFPFIKDSTEDEHFIDILCYTGTNICGAGKVCILKDNFAYFSIKPILWVLTRITSMCLEMKNVV